MQTIHRLNEEDIISILADKFNTDKKNVNISIIDEITNKGDREPVISAKIFENDKL